ncbi:penicillin-binding protein, beta-lactamase class C [Flavobacterium enshiense DK69]|uniref:Beta-lactamase n=1 Tax=Flavobacterium enshiense DK69 TaxID=1107311 RepID=V6SEQ7_9FLAO|nr:serine hydrolase [Flavobacterium enshiense]ESU22900.1 penicillin-binding protein, beta-lactamase class C [Flavobacterium enshiense DK69]KGO94032.1 beta-lactamase [Flavobacterium enshiense DK69]
MRLITTLSILLIGQILFGQNRVQKIDSLLTVMHKNEKLNGSVLIAEKGKVIYKHSFGYSNEETKQELDENSIFELASCSKQFTAMAIMMLKENGRLNLDDNISKFIPELANYKDITIRNLLNHTGGLPDYMVLMDSLFDKSKIATNKDIISIFSKNQPKIVFEPNTKYEYSNTGYALLASIIEKASGQTFADYLQKKIFTPLKMTKSFVYTRRYSPKKVDNYAFGYVYSDSLKKYFLPDSLTETNMVIWLDGIVGDGCVNSTVNDLLKWDRALYTNKLLSKEGMAELFQVATLNDKSKTKYGFGWAIDDNADFGKIVSHSGGWPGYVTYIDRHITNDKTIIILQNHNNVSIPVKSIRSILYNKPLPKPIVRKEVALPTEQLQKLIGVYEVEKDFEIKIKLENNQLFTQLTGQNAFPIFAESEQLFFLKVVDAQLQFEKNDKDEIVKLYLLQNGNKIEAKRIK